MSLNMKCCLELNVPQMECPSKWKVAKNGMSLKMEYHSKWNVTLNGMSLKI